MANVMTLEKLVKLLEPICTEKQLLKAFQFGSRVWGTATAQTDWDFFVVIEDYKGPVHLKLDTSVVGCDVDISAYSPESWRKLLEVKNDILALLCENLPAPFRWKDTYKAYSTPFLKQLVRCVGKEVNTCLSMSQVHFPTNKRTSLKNFVHGFRYIAFGTQLAIDGKVTNLGVVNHRYYEVMQRLPGIEGTTYDLHAAVYRPQLIAASAEFREMVTRMIVDELRFQAPLKSGNSTPYAALELYLQKNSLERLHRFFGISSTFIANPNPLEHTYLITACQDSPENEPITAACGATVYDIVSKTVVAFPHGFIVEHTIDTLEPLPERLSMNEGPFLATEVRVGDVEIVMWWTSAEGGKWTFYATKFQGEMSGDTALALEQFRTHFVEMQYEYPQDRSLCPSFLFNSRDQEIRPIAVSTRLGNLLDLQPATSFLNWPYMDLKSIPSVKDLRVEVSALEATPLLYRGLVVLGERFGVFLSSRSRNAFLHFSEAAEDVKAANKDNLGLKYIAMALSIIDEKTDAVLPLLDPVSLAGVLKEHAECVAMMGVVNFFWDLVKDQVDNVQEFVAKMKAFGFWTPMLPIMQTIRQYPGQNPLVCLKSSPVKSYQAWKKAFDPIKTKKLVDSIKSQQNKE